MSEWWNREEKIPLTDSTFLKILDFYLFHCPAETKKTPKTGAIVYSKVSKRAATLRAQGWTNGNLKILLSAMKHTASKQLEYHTFDTKTEIGFAVKRIESDTSLSDGDFEMIAITERSDMNKTSAIFYYIRNALAHGSFSVFNDNGKRVYYFESAKDNKIKAQIRLWEKTLLSWIDAFYLSPKKLHMILEEERYNRRKCSKGKKHKPAA